MIYIVNYYLLFHILYNQIYLYNFDMNPIANHNSYHITNIPLMIQINNNFYNSSEQNHIINSSVKQGSILINMSRIPHSHQMSYMSHKMESH